MKEFKIAVSCGETSGDLNAGYLISKLKEKYPNIYFYGIGGKHLKEAGCHIMYETDKFGTIGVAQAIKVYFKLLYIYKRFKKFIIKDKPDLLLCVDFGFFNSWLIRRAHENGIKNIYYFPPASWKKNLRHANSLVEAESKVITPFPWSEEILKGFGLEAKFLGHPLLDLAKPSISKEDFHKENNINENNQILGFLPGSRKFEIGMHLKAYADTMEKLYNENKNYIFLVATSEKFKNYTINGFKKHAKNSFNNIRFITNQAYNIMAYSEFLFCCSGTATLESSIIGTPLVVLYKGTKVMKFEYLFRKKFLPTVIGMPNIILDKVFLPELISDHVNCDEMIKAYKDSMNNLEEIKEDFKQIKSILGESPVIYKIRDTFAEMAGLE